LTLVWASKYDENCASFVRGLLRRMTMTVDERDQLQTFLRQLLHSRAAPKDAVAEALIKEACSQHADALYLLVQRSMAADMALRAALAQNPEMRARLDQTGAASSPWGKGMLGIMASTAVGVVAGSLLLEGMQDLMDDSLDLAGDDWS
jgi:hypothetical protein